MLLLLLAGPVELNGGGSESPVDRQGCFIGWRCEMGNFQRDAADAGKKLSIKTLVRGSASAWAGWGTEPTVCRGLVRPAVSCAPRLVSAVRLASRDGGLSLSTLWMEGGRGQLNQPSQDAGMKAKRWVHSISLFSHIHTSRITQQHGSRDSDGLCAPRPSSLIPSLSAWEEHQLAIGILPHHSQVPGGR